MGMKCEQFVELVTEYLDDAMDSETRQRFEEHLILCPGCVTYLDQIRETVRQTGHLQVEDLSPSAREQLLEAFNDWKAR